MLDSPAVSRTLRVAVAGVWLLMAAALFFGASVVGGAIAGSLVAAVILGLILGEIIENSLRKQIIIGDGSGMGFLTRPVSVLVLTVAALTFLWPMISRQLKRGKA